MVRILHTADWHLGQTLHGVSRTYEHAAFLEWLAAELQRQAVEVLIVAGDVFDTAHPGPGAQEAYYGFLARCRELCPQLSIVVVGGNHDSPLRLDAPRALLGALDITVVGGLPRDAAGAIDLRRAVVEVGTRGGRSGALVLAVPFLRRADLDLGPLPAGGPAAPEAAGAEQDTVHAALIDAYRGLYARLAAEAIARRRPGQALIATGHCYMVGGLVSELSERKVQVGNQHALPADIFPESIGYVALGHLHRAQAVGGRDHVRYAGSPIPLSMAERTYAHQVLLADVGAGGIERLEPRLVPRAVDILSVPETHAPLAAVLEALAQLPERDATAPSDATCPLLEVKVLLEDTNPRLRQDIEAALAARAARLVRIDARFAPGTERHLISPERDLASIAPEDVFRAAYARQRGGEAPARILGLFRELLEDVERRRGEDGAS